MGQWPLWASHRRELGVWLNALSVLLSYHALNGLRHHPRCHRLLHVYSSKPSPRMPKTAGPVWTALVPMASAAARVRIAPPRTSANGLIQKHVSAASVPRPNRSPQGYAARIASVRMVPPLCPGGVGCDVP